MIFRYLVGREICAAKCGDTATRHSAAAPQLHAIKIAFDLPTTFKTPLIIKPQD